MTGSEGRGRAEPRNRGGRGVRGAVAGWGGGCGESRRVRAGRSQLGGQGSGAPGRKGRGRGEGSGASRALRVRAHYYNIYIPS